MVYWKVMISDHFMKRWKQRIGTKITKNKASNIISKVLFSKSRLGIDNIDNKSDEFRFLLRIPSHNVIVVLTFHDFKPAYLAKTCWNLKGGNHVDESNSRRKKVRQNNKVDKDVC